MRHGKIAALLIFVASASCSRVCAPGTVLLNVKLDSGLTAAQLKAANSVMVELLDDAAGDGGLANGDDAGSVGGTQAVQAINTSNFKGTAQIAINLDPNYIKGDVIHVLVFVLNGSGAAIARADKHITLSQDCSTAEIDLTSEVPVSSDGGQSGSQLVASPAIATADGKDQIAITITLRDGLGLAMAAQQVTISVSGSQNTIIQPAATDSTGATIATLKSTVAESKLVTASVGGVVIGETVVQFDYAPPTIQCTPPSLTLFANGCAKVQCTATQLQSQPVALGIAYDGRAATVHPNTNPATIPSSPTGTTTTVSWDSFPDISQPTSDDFTSSHYVQFEPSVSSRLGASAISGQSQAFELDTYNRVLFAQRSLAINEGYGFSTYADVNNDGTNDIITADQNNSVIIQLNYGNGTFSEPQSIIVGSTPVAVGLGDVNSDGITDIVVSIEGDNEVGVLIGTGGANFLPVVTYEAGLGPGPLVLADFNGDGKIDIANLNVQGPLSVFLNKGDGTYLPQQTLAGANGPSGIASGDINGDHKIDLVIANANDSTAVFFLGNGDGTFATPTTISSVNYPTGIFLTKLNNDNFLDIVMPTGYGVSTSLGNGDGTFSAVSTISLPTSAGTIALGDVNQDHKIDIVSFPGGGASDVSLLLGNGDGTFMTPTVIEQLSNGYSVALVDIEGDGKLDLVATDITDGSVNFWVGNGDGTFSQLTDSVALGVNQPYGMALGDVNGDGIADVVTAGFGFNHNLSVLIGKGGGSFLPYTLYSVAEPAFTPVLADLNDDHKLDVVVGCAHSVSVLLGAGDGTFGATTNLTVGSRPVSVAVGDMNGDQNPDILAIDNANNEVFISYGAGAGTFAATAIPVSVGTSPYSLVVADVNGDQKLDILTSNNGSNDLSVLLGKGDGTFQPIASFANENGPTLIAVGDVDGDHKLDVVTAIPGTSSLATLLGNGDGTFRAPIASPATASTNVTSMQLGDINGDGFADVIIADAIASVVVALGKGDGTFIASAKFSDSGFPETALLSDLNGDGRLDILVDNLGSGDMSIFWNDMPLACH